MWLSTLSLSASAGAAGDPLASQPLSADPWLGPIGPSALYAADEPAGGRRGLWLGVSAGMSRGAGERERIFGLLELGFGLDAALATSSADADLDAALAPEGSSALATSSADADLDADADADADAYRADPSPPEQRWPPRRSLAPDTQIGADPTTRDAAPRNLTPRNPAPRDLTSDDATPADPTPRDLTRNPTPRDPTPRDPTPRDPAPRDPSPRSPALREPAFRAPAARAPTPHDLAAPEPPPIEGGCEPSRSCDPAAVAALARAVVAEALRVQGGALELRRLDGMAARSRVAAALPEVRLGAGTSRDESLRLSPTLADPARFTRDGGRDLWLEARLTWRLDGALFARDEIAIMRLRAQQREEATRLTRGVLEALIALERARLLLASETAPPEEREAAAVRQFGAVAELDVLTAGWFSRRLARARGGARGDGAPGSWP